MEARGRRSPAHRTISVRWLAATMRRAQCRRWSAGQERELLELVSSRPHLSNHVVARVFAIQDRLLRTDDEQLVDPGGRSPHLTMTPKHLAHLGVWTRQRRDLELLSCWIESRHRIRAPVADPDHVLVVDIDRVGLRALPGQLP